MAFVSGTATNYLDLYDQFVTFLTTTLPVGQRWTVLAAETNPVSIVNGTRLTYLRAPGLAGTDQIFSVLYAYGNVGGDYYNIGLRGSIGYIPTDAYNAQPGISSPVYTLLWNSTIPFWFIGNGRRAMIVAKVSTVYQVMHVGFITPYASPGEYGYPLLVGGMWGGVSATRWSSVAAQHKAFFSPANTSAIALGSGAYLRVPGGAWLQFQNYGTASDESSFSTGSRVWPFSGVVDSSQFKMKTLFAGAGYALYPAVMFSDIGPAVFGEIEGVFSISGFANAAENIITIGGTNYLVVPNAFRSSVEHYAAFRLN